LGALGRFLTAVALVAAGLQLAPVAASAAPVAGTLSAGVDDPMVGEQVELTGSLPASRPRPLALERRSGNGGWTQAATGRSAADGTFAFGTTVPGAVGATVSYRVQAPEVRRDGTVLPALQTPDLALTTVPQAATLAAPSSVAAGSTVGVVADFSPDRPGRSVALQRRDGSRWTAVATTTQDASGVARFSVPAGSATGSVTFRAIAKKADGAVRHVSPTATVAVTAVVDTTPPAVPTGVSATPGDASAALSWSAVVDAAGYRVHRAASSTGPWTVIASPTGTTHEELGLTNGSSYWFAVSAVDATENESPRSEAVSVTPVDGTAPAVPSGLVATAGDSAVSLTWDEVVDAARYVVEQATSEGGPWTTAGSPTSGSLDVSDLTNGTPYWFTVAAVDAAGNHSEPSVAVSATPVDGTPPPPVTLLSATPSDRRVTLVWETSGSADVTAYDIERSASSDGPFVPAAQGVPSSPYTVTGLDNGTALWFRVLSRDAVGNLSTPSEAMAATPVDDVAPPVPGPLTATGRDRAIHLAWGGAYGGDDYAGFHVHLAASADGPWTQLNDEPVETTPYLVTGLTNGVTYWVSVTSVDTLGNQSERATPVSAVPYDDVAPPVPNGLTAVATPGQVTVSWAAVADDALVDYVVSRGASDTGPWERIEWGTSTATTFQDASVVPGTTYWYVVQSVDAAGNWSSASAPASATAAETTPPAVPTGLAATPGDRQVQLTWNAVQDADLAGYRVHRAVSAEGPWTTSTDPITATATTVTDLQNGEEHWFAVSAVDGIGNESARSTPVTATPIAQPPAPTTVSAFSQHSCEVRRDGSLWCWGVGSTGALGTGSTSPTRQPTPVRVGTGTDWAGVSVGALFTCATKADGTAWCWGRNTEGQLGDGSTTTRPSPTQVGIASDWLLLDAGASHTCGLRADRSLWCWGLGQQGRLGTGGTANQSVPQQVAGSWVRLSAGGARTCAVRADGSTWCWGAGFGGFGTQDLVPVQVGGAHDWADVTTGSDHACGLRADRSAWCWGSGFSGQLGSGATDRAVVPVRVFGASDWASVSAGGSHTCGTRTDASAWCWGSSRYGQLGDGTATDRSQPVRVGGDLTAWSTVSAGNNHTCAAPLTGPTHCWGYVGDGVLGTGRTENVLQPQAVTGAGDWSTVTAGNQHGCGIRVDASLWCWGSNFSGQVGDGSRTSRFLPVRVGTASWASVSAGGNFTCGLRTDGSAWCWGTNERGQVGDGSSIDRLVPTRVGTAADWASVSAGEWHACGTRTDGSAWCWGRGDFGQIGDGGTVDRSTPTQVAPATGWTGVSSGNAYTCGTRSDGTAWCWGANSVGQLGDGTTTDRPTPTRIGTADDWDAVDAGTSHACGMRLDGTAWCWGVNNNGELGDGTSTWRTSPVQVLGAGWSLVVAGGSHSCGTRVDGSAWCWGANGSGGVGDGTSTVRRSPTRVGAGTDWTAVSAGGSHTCGLRGGSASCWGWNNVGQTGSPPYEALPVPVAS
jgi:alpha-tubulin suppressor-like RCC1 family protein